MSTVAGSRSSRREVRKLAERAQESTGQIAAIVGEIQAETNATIIASRGGREGGPHRS